MMKVKQKRMYSSNGKYLLQITQGTAQVLCMDDSRTKLELDAVVAGGCFRKNRQDWIWLSRNDQSIYLQNMQTGQWVAHRWLYQIQWKYVYPNSTGTTLVVNASSGTGDYLLIYDFTNSELVAYDLPSHISQLPQNNHRLVWLNVHTFVYTVYSKKNWTHIITVNMETGNVNVRVNERNV